MKKTDWDKCLICQCSSDQEKGTLRKASSDGIKVFQEANTKRKDDMFERLRADLEHLPMFPDLWHGPCYQSYTSKQNLRYFKPSCSKSFQGPVSEPEGDPSSAVEGSRSSRSRVAPIDWSLCVFCQKKKHKGCKDLINVTSFDSCESIRHAAEVRNDQEMLVKIQEIDQIASEAKYYNACRSKYVSKSNLRYQDKWENTSESGLYDKAFEKMALELQPEIDAGKAYDMTSLLLRYQSLLLQYGVETEKSYRSQRLKNLLKLYFKNGIFSTKKQIPQNLKLCIQVGSPQDVINDANNVKIAEAKRTGCGHKPRERNY